MILDYLDEPSFISSVLIRRYQDSLNQRRCGSRGQRDEARNREHRDPLEAGKAREQSLPRAFGEHSSVDTMTAQDLFMKTEQGSCSSSSLSSLTPQTTYGWWVGKNRFGELLKLDPPLSQDLQCRDLHGRVRFSR